MEPPVDKSIRRVTLLADLLLLILAVPVSAAAHSALKGVVPYIRELASPDQLIVLPILVVPLFLALLVGFGLDRIGEKEWTSASVMLGLFKVHGVVFLVLAAIIFLTQTVVNRSLAALYLMCTFCTLAVERLLVLRWKQHRYSSGQGQRRLLLVGDYSDLMQSFVQSAARSTQPPAFVGVLAPVARKELFLPLLGDPDSLPVVLHESAVDEVLFFEPFAAPDKARRLLDACETVGVPAEFVIEMPRPSLATPRIVTRYGVPCISFEVAPRSPDALALKQALDVIVAAAVLILVSPLLLLAVVGIFVTMGRPIFFVQERAGLFGRTFRMYKLRTMRRGAEAAREELAGQNELSGPVFKLTADPRITPFGRLLRKFSIDELPQLFHVLAGTMSLVGPRPLPVKEQALIRGWHRRRLSMRPGLTGLWQVSGRSDIDFEQWMKLDLEYVDHWSLGLDLMLLVKTIPVVVLGRGAR